MNDLINPPCAEVWASRRRKKCRRCHLLPGQNCLDTAARAAQEAMRTLGGSQVATHSPEAPTALPGGVAEGLELPWRMEGSSIVPDGPARRYGPITSYVGEDDGAHIILAANHHAALVDALEACIKPWAFQSDDQLEGIIKHASHHEIRAKLQATLTARALLERIRAGGGG